MKQSWRDRPEAAGAAVIRISRRVVLVLGRSLSRALLLPATLYFLIRRGPERRASRSYLRRVLPRAVTLLDVARHFFVFSATTLDRVYLLTERFRRFSITVSGLEAVDHALEKGRGLLLFGSHLGSFDALRVLSLERPDIMVRIVLDVEHNPGISDALNSLNPELAATIINARTAGPALALAIREALDRNAIVALLVDRARPGNAVQTARFLGSPAPFPQSPWLLAAALKTPVLLSFGLYRGGNRYDLHFETFAPSLTIGRQARAQALAELVQRYADRLAHYARLAPLNWFNFYDFWKLPDSGDGSCAPDGSGGVLRRGSL